MHPMYMIQAMQELMDRHGYRYSFAIWYRVQYNSVHADINPASTKDCAYPITLIATNDR